MSERHTILFDDRWFTAQGKWFWRCDSLEEARNPIIRGMGVKYYDMPLVTTWDNQLLDLGGELWEPNPEYVEPPTGEQIDMDDMLMPTKEQCCDSLRPQNMVDVLKDKAATLSSRLTDVNLAIQALEKNPELSSTLDLIRRVGRY